MKLFDLFKSAPKLASLAPLGVDMHSHLLPGIDDGAGTMADSLALVRRMIDLGFTELWTTPHVMADLYPNTPEIIQARLEEVRHAIRKAGLPIQIHAAAEYLLDEAFGEKIDRQELLTLPGKRVLVEMSFVSATPQLDQHIFQLQTKGYKVILAHPERYLYYRNDFQAYERLHTRGVEFQVNLLSLARYYSSGTYENALRLLEAGMVDYLGTDMHHLAHADKITQVVADRKSSRLLAKYAANLKNKELRIQPSEKLPES